MLALAVQLKKAKTGLDWKSSNYPSGSQRFGVKLLVQKRLVPLHLPHSPHPFCSISFSSFTALARE